jgi:hypothetical protein
VESDGNEILSISLHISPSGAGVCHHSHRMSSNAVARTNRLASSYQDCLTHCCNPAFTHCHNPARTHCHNPARTHAHSNVNQRTTADADHPIQDEVSRQSH